MTENRTWGGALDSWSWSAGFRADDAFEIMWKGGLGAVGLALLASILSFPVLAGGLAIGAAAGAGLFASFWAINRAMEFGLALASEYVEPSENPFLDA